MTKKQKTKLKTFNQLEKILIDEDGGAWRVPDNEKTSILKWLIINDLTCIEYVYQLATTYDNMNTCNFEIINRDNLDEYNDDVLKSQTGHKREYLRKLFNDGLIGYILNYPRIQNGRCFIYPCSIKYDLKQLQEKPAHKRPRFIVLGCKWFDKINGNTYHNAKIYDTLKNKTYYCGFSYGYGSAYIYSALEYIKNNVYTRAKLEDIYNIGCMFDTKYNTKNNMF